MTPAQLQRVRDLFEALVDLDPPDARRRLELEATDDAAVRAEVASLLDHHSRAGTFLVEPPVLEMRELGSELEPGTTLGAYSVVREIGHGGMGCVYLAFDTRLRRQVCLKAVRGDLAGDSRFRDRLRREARLAASLNHPGICAIYALEEFNGQLYLVTEFVEGQTLRAENEGGTRPSSSDVAKTMVELATALAAAHAKGITHRDLKPENVMRSVEGQLKILDFGLARAEVEPAMAVSMATLPGVLMGTPRYMAPEQVEGGQADRRTDLFAFGVLIYEYATGMHPFAAQTGLATAGRILEHTPPSLAQSRPDLPAALVEAVDRCLRKKPAERFQIAADVLAALHDTRLDGDGRRRTTVWWQLHQVAIVALYFVACAAAWLIKEWEPGLTTRWVFAATSGLAAVGGIVRGHLLFTERTHPRRLAAERQKTRLVLLGLDLGLGLALVVDASLANAARPVVSVLVMALAAGIGTAAVFIEPATTAATFDHP